MKKIKKIKEISYKIFNNKGNDTSLVIKKKNRYLTRQNFECSIENRNIGYSWIEN